MFRYRDAHGFEKRLINEAALLEAIRAGEVQASTPLAGGVDGGWGLAARHPAFARAQEGRGVAARLRGAGAGEPRALLLRPRVLGAVGVVVVLLVAGGFTLSHLRERTLAEQRRAYAEAMLGFAHGHAPAPELVAGAVGVPIADDAALRTLWVRFQVARSIARSADSAMTVFAVRGFLPPDGWMSDDYVRNARGFAAIGRHWSAYLEWDRAWSDDAEDLLRAENARFATEAALTERQTFELIDPAQPGLSAVGWDLELRRRFAEEASRLHTTLVQSRGNAFISDGRWWFADTRTQRAYAEHRQNLQRIAQQLEDNAARRAAALGVPTPDGAVPAVVRHLRPAGG